MLLLKKLNQKFCRLLQKPYAVPVIIGVFFLALSILTRFALVIHSGAQATFLGFLGIFFYGFLFDLTITLWFSVPALLYFTWVPESWYIANWHRRLSGGVLLFLCWAMFLNSFVEFFFWEEYSARLNFVAFDYLVYPREVLTFMWESYPVVPILLLLGILVFSSIWLTRKLGWWDSFFHRQLPHRHPLSRRHLAIAGSLLLITILVSSMHMPKTFSVVQQELAKNGLFSLTSTIYSIYRPYKAMYISIPEEKAIALTKMSLGIPAIQSQDPRELPLRHHIQGNGNPKKPNVIMVVMESFGGDYLRQFGEKNGLTPNISNLADKGLLFTNFHAGAIRTVGGLEGLLTSRPPLPNKSLFKRDHNCNVMTLGTIFRQKGYTSTYIYGGDSKFDNQKNFLSDNGFDILDIYHWIPEAKPLSSIITDEEEWTRFWRSAPTEFHALKKRLTPRPEDKKHDIFRTAWGVCDEQLFDWILEDADNRYRQGRPFFTTTLTASNHIPFFFPEGRIDIPPGTPTASVKYADYAIGQFMEKAKEKPWFHNTLFVFVADHCNHKSASEADMSPHNFRIPLIMYSPNPELLTPGVNHTLGGQIDVGPTLFGLFNWSYDSEFFGQDLIRIAPSKGRALLGTFKYLGLYDASNTISYLLPTQDYLPGIKILTVDPATKKAREMTGDLAPYEKLMDQNKALYQTAMYTYILQAEENRRKEANSSRLHRQLERLLEGSKEEDENPPRY